MSKQMEIAQTSKIDDSTEDKAESHMFCFKRNGKESLMDDLGQLLISWNLAI